MATALRVLMVEDNPVDAHMVRHALKQDGFLLSWQCVQTEADYLHHLHSDIDIILADYTLPTFDALRALQLLQEQHLDIPFIVVTGSVSEETAVRCMKQGASDYLIKDRLTRLGEAVRLALQAYNIRQEKRLSDMALRYANAQLLTAYDATIEGWAHALELRDVETEGHARRVTTMTVALAQAMHVSEADLVHIRRGALLHDIGKMAIPDSILFKPGPLTSEEWEMMRLHPVFAYEMLASIEFLRPALDIPYFHHEKWNGSGYPHGLIATRIPLAARIFAVVDVWDALRSKRHYKPAWSESEASSYIQAQAGQHFDPDVVDIFLQLQREGQFINAQSIETIAPRQPSVLQTLAYAAGQG